MMLSVWVWVAISLAVWALFSTVVAVAIGTVFHRASRAASDVNDGEMWSSMPIGRERSALLPALFERIELHETRELRE
jgi:hypothetical protein